VDFHCHVSLLEGNAEFFGVDLKENGLRVSKQPRVRSTYCLIQLNPALQPNIVDDVSVKK